MGKHRRLATALLGVLALGGCARPLPPASRPDPSTAVPAEPAPDPERRASDSRLERHRTNERSPSLTLISDYPVAQTVFVDGVPLGSVAPGETATFAVPSGVHRIVCADSEDPSDNATEIEETFDLGYGYTYRLRAR